MLGKSLKLMFNFKSVLNFSRFCSFVLLLLINLYIFFLVENEFLKPYLIEMLLCM